MARQLQQLRLSPRLPPFTPRFSFSSHSGLFPVPPAQYHPPAPGPLHLTFPPPGCSSLDTHKTCILASFQSLLNITLSEKPLLTSW